MTVQLRRPPALPPHGEEPLCVVEAPEPNRDGAPMMAEGARQTIAHLNRTWPFSASVNRKL